jgi:hypothetical protein
MGNKSMHPWDPDAYDDPTVKQFLQGLNQLANSNRDIVKRASGQYGNGKSSLFIRYVDWKLIEYRPADNQVLNTEDNHRRAGIPPELSYRYHQSLAESGKTIRDPRVILSLLGEMISELRKRKGY